VLLLLTLIFLALIFSRSFFLSFFFVLLVRCLSCILLVYLGCTFVLFNEFAITYKIGINTPLVPEFYVFLNLVPQFCLVS
jgi:hypothetical protein